MLEQEKRALAGLGWMALTILFGVFAGTLGMGLSAGMLRPELQGSTGGALCAVSAVIAVYSLSRMVRILTGSDPVR